MPARRFQGLRRSELHRATPSGYRTPPAGPKPSTAPTTRPKMALRGLLWGLVFVVPLWIAIFVIAQLLF